MNDQQSEIENPIPEPLPAMEPPKEPLPEVLPSWGTITEKGGPGPSERIERLEDLPEEGRVRGGS